MMQLYEFTVLRFYRLFLLTLQYIDTLRLYAFPILRLYRLLLFTLSTKRHKFTTLRFYYVLLRFPSLSHLLYGFTLLQLYYVFLPTLCTQNMNLRLDFGCMR